MGVTDGKKLQKIEQLISRQRKEQDELRSKHEREMGFALAYWDKSFIKSA